MKKLEKWTTFVADDCLDQRGCLFPVADNPTEPQPLDLTELDTQAEIDQFGTLGHTDYAERLVIGIENQPNSAITNLDALSGLTSVKGLTIYYNDELNDIKWLGQSSDNRDRWFGN